MRAVDGKQEINLEWPNQKYSLPKQNLVGQQSSPLGTCTRAVRLLEQLQLLVIVASQSQLCD